MGEKAEGFYDSSSYSFTYIASPYFSFLGKENKSG